MGFKDNDFDSSIFAIQNFKKDYQLPKSLPFIPEQVLRSLGRNNLSMDMSNSFLIIATNRQEGVTNNNYAWHISTSRFQQYCKLKRFTKNEKKGIDVFTEKICFKSSSVIYNQFLVQDLEIQSHYFKGKVLSEDFIDVVSMDGWGEKNLKNFLLKYLHALQNISGMAFPVNKPTTISGDYLDCLPHNIIEIENELFKFFDREWRLKVKIDTGFLVFRAILCLTSSISRFIKPQDYFFDNTILSFIKFSFMSLDWNISEKKLSEYIALEYKIQKLVSPSNLTDDEYNNSFYVQNFFERFIHTPQTFLNITIQERDNTIQERDNTIQERDNTIQEYDLELSEIYNTKTFRYTKFLRDRYKFIRKLFRKNLS